MVRDVHDPTDGRIADLHLPNAAPEPHVLLFRRPK